MRSAPILLLLVGLCALAPAVRAQEVVYGPDGAPTVVQRKLHRMSNRWELGLTGLAAVNTSLVDQYGGLASLSYHPNEWADVGVDLLANYTQLSGLSQQIRANLPSRLNGATRAPLVDDEMTNADQLRGAALAMARLAPFYGKLNLLGELSVHFQAFALLGAGCATLTDPCRASRGTSASRSHGRSRSRS